MNLVLFIAVLAVSFIVVRIGAVAFQLTGLEWSLAKFQSLSCFTGTGFTTREAELVTGNPQRRRIASIIMVLGNAGFITMIATFANSLRPQIVADKLNLPLLPDFLPSAFLPWINLAIIVATVYVMFRLFTNTKLVKKLTSALRRKLLARNIVSQVSFEELLLVSEGYGISRIQVCEESPILGKTLSESHLRKHDITILAIARKGKVIPNPSATTRILLGDELISFGRLENMRQRTCAA